MSEPSNNGIPCPSCGNDISQVTDSRPSDKNKAKRRRRVCEHCSLAYTTYEITAARMEAMLKIERTMQTVRATMTSTLKDIENLIQ